MALLYTTDLIIFPIYVGISMLFILFYSHYRVEHKYRPSFIISFFIKIICTIVFSLLFDSYYENGDTVNYYRDALQLKHFIEQDIENIKYYFLPTREFWFVCPECVVGYVDSNFLVVKIASLLLFPTLESYPTTALLLGILSSLGSYQIIKTFSKIFPNKNFKLAFFIPSVLFWGSGIMKDGLCIFALGYLFSTLEYIYYTKKTSLFQIVWIAILSYSILTLKGYILICFIFSYFIRIITQIYSTSLNKKTAVVSMTIASILLAFGLNIISSFSEKFVLDNLLDAGLFTQKYIYELQGGSTYEINYDSTPFGILSAIIQSFTVSFIRPYIWEANNPFVILFSIETILGFGFTITYLLTFLLQTENRDKIHPLIAFSFIFSVSFGIVVGFTSSNFGALMRYKIPYLLFYVLAILSLRTSTPPSDKK